MWNTEAPFGKLHNELIIVLEPHEIIAYHNTRLPDITSIERQGLIFSDDRYTDMIRAAMRDADITQPLIDEVIGIVILKWIK